MVTPSTVNGGGILKPRRNANLSAMSLAVNRVIPCATNKSLEVVIHECQPPANHQEAKLVERPVIRVR
jgi:hypothetical protein